MNEGRKKYTSHFSTRSFSDVIREVHASTHKSVREKEESVYISDYNNWPKFFLIMF